MFEVIIMKKLLISILFILSVMSMIFATTALAEESTPDTPPATEYVSTTPGLDAETDFQIKQDVITNVCPSEGYTVDDITLEYFGTISGGIIAVRYSFYSMSAPDIICNYTFGDYKLQYNGSDEVYLYIDRNFYRIADAYDNGLINYGQIEELAQIVSYFQKAEATKASTVETKPVSSPDTAVNNYNNTAIDAVQTGQSGTYAIALTALAVISLFAFVKTAKDKML